MCLQAYQIFHDWAYDFWTPHLRIIFREKIPHVVGIMAGDIYNSDKAKSQ